MFHLHLLAHKTSRYKFCDIPLHTRPSLQQIYELVTHKIMSQKVTITSHFEFGDEKIDVTTFVTLEPSLKAKSDDIIISSRINRE